MHVIGASLAVSPGELAATVAAVNAAGGQALLSGRPAELAGLSMTVAECELLVSLTTAALDGEEPEPSWTRTDCAPS